jgi:hypothetical protein
MQRLAKPKTNAMKKSFSYAAANIWNSQSTSERKQVINLIPMIWYTVGYGVLNVLDM